MNTENASSFNDLEKGIAVRKGFNKAMNTEKKADYRDTIYPVLIDTKTTKQKARYGSGVWRIWSLWSTPHLKGYYKTENAAKRAIEKEA